MTNKPSILKTTLKATVFATIFFNLSLFLIEDVFLPLVLVLSFFVIGFISFFMLTTTVCPFIYLSEGKSNNEIFKTFFPWFAFGTMCGYMWLISNIYPDNLTYMVFAIAYFTGLQSWIWFYSPSKNTSNAK